MTLHKASRPRTRDVAQLDKRIAGQDKLLDNESKDIAKSKKPKALVFDLAYRDKLLQRRFGKATRLTVLNNKAKAVAGRLLANVPGICFGSRKLFKQQFHLETTEFGAGDAGHAAWKRAWRDSRSHQFFLVGSGDETAGNQSCKASVVHAPPTTEIAARPTLTLAIKMPAALIAKEAPKFLKIEGVHFEYGNEQVLQALANGTALTYRFHSDNHSAVGWRVFVSTDTIDTKLTTLQANLGTLGVDFNADHLAVAKTDRFGNAVQFWHFDLPFTSKASGQRDAILSDALDKVFALAKEHKCPVAMEDLDFSAKKKELTKLGMKHARMLSGLAYASYKQLSLAKASRLGVELIFVDPAYTSVAGSVKYAVRLGRTVHQAAAGVIARRAQGYSEKLPKSDAKGEYTFRAPLMGRMAVLTLPVESSKRTHVSLAVIRRSLSRHCAEQVRLRKESTNGRCKRANVSSNLLDEDPSSSREPVKLLDRRAIPPDFTDVPL